MIYFNLLHWNFVVVRMNNMMHMVLVSFVLSLMLMINNSVLMV